MFPPGSPLRWTRLEWIRASARVTWLCVRALAGSKRAREEVHVRRQEIRARARDAGMKVEWTLPLEDDE